MCLSISVYFFIEAAFVADIVTEARRIAVKIVVGRGIVHLLLCMFLVAGSVVLDILADTLVEDLVVWEKACSIVVAEVTVVRSRICHLQVTTR